MLHHHVLVVGDNYVGKTSLCLRLAMDLPPSSSYMSTLNFDSFFARIGPTHSITLYDMPGHSRFHRHAETRYANCDVVILMGRGRHIDDTWFERISAWAPLASWLVVSRSSSDGWRTYARQRHLTYCQLDIHGDIDNFIQALVRQCSLHAARPVPVQLQDTSDEQYLSYCT